MSEPSEPREQGTADTIGGAVGLLFDILGWLGGISVDDEEEEDLADSEVVETDGEEIEEE